MLAFVTSLRHPHNSTDYERVERLLHRTLTSVQAQTVDAHITVVVGNREPQRALPSGTRFVLVDHPPPSPEGTTKIPREAVLRDKGVKLALGAIAALREGPTHVMILDADDLVSRRLAATVKADSRSSGWYFEHGYVYSARRGLTEPVDRFHERCGSSHILATDLLRLPDVPLSLSPEEVMSAVGERHVHNLFGSHLHAIAHSAALGRPLRELPYPGALYVVETGENHSGRKLRGRVKPVGPQLAEEFGLARTDRSPKTLLHAAAHRGRRALLEMGVRR